MPLAVDLVENMGRKILVLSLVGMPEPLSLTVIVSWVLVGLSLMVTVGFLVLIWE